MAAGILLALGFSLESAIEALRHGQAPPGRMELIGAGATKPQVVVDFAHTPDALSKALTAVRDHCSGQVWCGFGCGGERDAGKRGPMGAIATSLADQSIITDDNPRHEDPVAIIDDIIAGVGDSGIVEVVQDRAAAIDFAIRSAQPDDVVLIAGKGHETVQIVGDRTVKFSDTAFARIALGLAV